MRTLQHIAKSMMFLGVATLASVGTAVAADHACTIRPVDFEGWHAQEISNDWVRLTIVPQLGGRLMQVSFGGHAFLFVNPKYKGKYIPPSEAAGRWINYGGDKIWPLPEGNEDEHHWVLKSDPLDDGEYSFHSSIQDERCSATLQGPPDPVTGLQYTREIGVGSHSPAISFHAVMKNIAGHPIEWSVQSVTQYDLADQRSPKGFNRDFYAFAPLNQHSAYFTGYQVRDGLADDPSFELKNGLFRLHWLYLENEVWLDSPAGWLALVDRASHYAMVERFSYQPHATYPGNATVIFYKNGASLGIDENQLPALNSATPGETPYYMEAELNSPMVSLRPGESYAFDTQWLPTRSGNNFVAVSDAGIVEVSPTAVPNANGLVITGTFDVFFPGTVRARFLNSSGSELGQVLLAKADPEEPLSLHAEVTAPALTARVSLHLVDDQGVDRGVLGEAEVQRKTGDTA